MFKSLGTMIILFLLLSITSCRDVYIENISPEINATFSYEVFGPTEAYPSGGVKFIITLEDQVLEFILQNGSTVEIGENGNWLVNGEDTGVSARGETGEPGKTGGSPYPFITEIPPTPEHTNGGLLYTWYILDENLELTDESQIIGAYPVWHGNDGENGENGANGNQLDFIVTPAIECENGGYTLEILLDDITSYVFTICNGETGPAGPSGDCEDCEGINCGYNSDQFVLTKEWVFIDEDFNKKIPDNWVLDNFEKKKNYSFLTTTTPFENFGYRSFTTDYLENVFELNLISIDSRVFKGTATAKYILELELENGVTLTLSPKEINLNTSWKNITWESSWQCVRRIKLLLEADIKSDNMIKIDNVFVQGIRIND